MVHVPLLLGVPKPPPIFLRPPHHAPLPLQPLANTSLNRTANHLPLLANCCKNARSRLPPPFIKHSLLQLLDWLLWNNLNVHSPFEGQVLRQQLCYTHCCVNYSSLATHASFIIKLLGRLACGLIQCHHSGCGRNPAICKSSNTLRAYLCQQLHCHSWWWWQL